jgi:hypothetical protein
MTCPSWCKFGWQANILYERHSFIQNISPKSAPLLLFAQKLAACEIDQKLHVDLFTLYLNNEPLFPYDFSIFGMYSLRPIAQCNLCTESLIIKISCQRLVIWDCAPPRVISWLKFSKVKQDISVGCYYTVHRKKRIMKIHLVLPENEET